MAESSTKPYMIRALYEWCCDNGYTPYLAVVVDEHTIVPRQHVKAGEIVLNVSPMATSRLTLGNEVVEFQARFSGVAQQISVPVGNVSAIYARETGHGMVFDVSRAPAESDEDAGPNASGHVHDHSPHHASGAEDEVGNHAPGSSVQSLRGGSRRRGPRSVDREDMANAGSAPGREKSLDKGEDGGEGYRAGHPGDSNDLHEAGTSDQAANARKRSSKEQGSADVIAFAPTGGSRRKKAGSAASSSRSKSDESAGESSAGDDKSGDNKSGDGSEDPPPSDGGSQGGKGGKARLTRVK